MNRLYTSFPVTNFYTFKLQMLNWSTRFNICCFLDNHNYQISPHSYECILAAGALQFIEAKSGDAFNQLKVFSDAQPDWLFGHFSYDLKNEIEQLRSERPDHIQFPDLFFFVPRIIVRLDADRVTIGVIDEDASQILHSILSTPATFAEQDADALIAVKQRFSHEHYVNVIEKLKSHIHRGDCYEINFCQEFFADNVDIDPVAVYDSLGTISPNPFSAFYRLDERYLMCASPERYLKKTGTQLISQPMKGTSGRSDDALNDQSKKVRLSESAKEKTENVMIVDLVRNDLSKICREGTVHVEELFGIYAFPQVYQMISTVTGELQPDMHWVDAIRSSFPMGSMTGAPKKRVMELIEQYEQTKRGIFSGAVGYVTPERDFDFNVVIRSIMYNRNERYLSYQAGSGITYYSNPETEYEECLLKVEAIKKVLTRSVSQHF